ncbi:type VI secretion system baseplate subunit TssF [Sulfurimonas lithotrophica]|uniref:Type VI secretion system baseplate subunit TssF n=1 Tax=Sulfurimonas lithotrophica TaxID=2590022 RepID=A0A5P8NZP7_9BACT|nr:type VI secretion system baseplate subunit TssF [Sulfurimonas lithotrophica]QFR48935.1 type VI secretion system baseplate subunit TssF [Sulfurimonas lithotrophica]
MEFNDYYRQELTALRVEGTEFSKRNPGLSTFLSREGQDPDVERLLEGFAFLTGRLRQQIDKELPEVAHTLVQLLWPNYVRSIPSYTIIQYKALEDRCETILVEKDTKILSKKVANGVQCPFKTSYDTEVMALKINDLNYYVHGEKSSIELDLNMTAAGSLDDLNLSKLRFYIGGSKFVAKDLYMFLTRFLESVEIEVYSSDEKNSKKVSLDISSLVPVGFQTNERLGSYPLNVFDGYTLLQEYFCYPNKFLFVDFLNLNKINALEKEYLRKSRSFTIHFHFSKRLQSNESPTKDNFSLYCTPAINLFQTESVPIRKNETQEEYLVVPSDISREHSEVYSIDSVRGWIQAKNRYDDYQLFESFEHNDDSQYYSTRVKLSIDGERTNTYLRFASNNGAEENIENSDSTVSVQITCTNSNTPHDNILIGDINLPDPLSKTEKLKFKNITIPSSSYPPPLNGDFLWKVISNMSLNYLSLENIQALRKIIETYDFIGQNDIKQREKTSVMLQGLKSIDYKTIEMMDKGFPLRGIEVSIVIDPKKFECLGDAYILCSILNEFLTLYGNINSFHQLNVDIIGEDVFKWQPKMGTEVVG